MCRSPFSIAVPLTFLVPFNSSSARDPRRTSGFFRLLLLVPLCSTFTELGSQAVSSVHFASRFWCGGSKGVTSIGQSRVVLHKLKDPFYILGQSRTEVVAVHCQWFLTFVQTFCVRDPVSLSLFFVNFSLFSPLVYQFFLSNLPFCHASDKHTNRPSDAIRFKLKLWSYSRRHKRSDRKHYN